MDQGSRLKTKPSSSVSHSEDTDEEINYSFAGIDVCFHAEKEAINWVIDTGATDHMTSLPKFLHDIKNNTTTSYIKLPNGTQAPITHVGNMNLFNDLILTETLVVPTLKYNLLSVSKLCRDNDCIAIFHEEICLFQVCAIGKVKGIGEPEEVSIIW